MRNHRGRKLLQTSTILGVILLMFFITHCDKHVPDRDTAMVTIQTDTTTNVIESEIHTR